VSQPRFSSIETAIATARSLRRIGRPTEARRIYEVLVQSRATRKVDAIASAAIDNGLARLDIDAERRRPQVVWLLSYPRTGSTWLRFMLTHLMAGDFDSSRVVNDITPTLEYGTTAAQFRDERVTFMKTHYAYPSFLKEADDFIDLTAGAIYICRHPADVLASTYNYLRRQGNDPDSTLEQGIDAYADSFITNRGAARFVQVGHGTYLGHFVQWRTQPLVRNLIHVRYEDMIEKPAEVLQLIARRWQLPVTEARIQAAVAACQFERMRTLEDAEANSAAAVDSLKKKSYGFSEHTAFPPAMSVGRSKDLKFVNRGEAGYGKEMLDPTVYARMAEAFQPLMQPLGYE